MDANNSSTILEGVIRNLSERDSYADLEWHTHIFVVLIGLLVGGIGGFAGIGGAPFMVGLLKLFVKFCQHEAQGTVLAVMLPPMSLMGVLVMKDRAVLIWRYVVPAFFAYATFSYAGAEFAYLFDSDGLSILFGSFLCCLSLNYARQYVAASRAAKAAKAPSAQVVDPEQVAVEVETAAEVEAAAEKMNPEGPTIAEGAKYAFNYRNIAIVGAVVGIVGGMFGVGAGVLMVPIFTDLFGLHKDDARTMSLMILLPPVSAGAVIKYAMEDGVDFPVAGVLFALYFVSNHSGSKVGRNMSTKMFKVYLGMLLGVLGSLIIMFAFTGNPMYPDADEACED